MTDRLYFDNGTHKDFAAVVEREASVTGVTPNGDREYYSYTEVAKTIQGVERYSGDGEAVSYETGKGMSETTDSPSQATEADATDDTPQPSTGDGNGRKRLYNALMDAGIDVDDVSVTNVPSNEEYRIEFSDDFDDYDLRDSWTEDRFGKDNPGWIDYEKYEKDDGSDGFIPQSFVVPYDALEDVVG